ncbi:hypothetical protein [Limnobacter sp.]|uniref:hypothetical protein n=1 Tax=Limnobacter sp. TaxID=2003368 RepID=UPI0035198500
MLLTSRRFFCLFCLALLLQACSPAYNWRAVPNSDVGYVATFPDKPAMVTRTLDLAGLKVPLTLHAAQVDGSYFAVGTVPLQGPLQGQGEVLRNALAQALANNVQAGAAQLQSTEWLGQPAWRVELQGSLPSGEAGHAVARFFEHRGVLYQVTLMGPGQQALPEIQTTWFSGFSLLGQ